MNSLLKAVRDGALIAVMLAGLAAIGALVWASVAFGTDQEDDQDIYCKMVEEGTWPDYKDTFEKSCKKMLT